MIFLHLIFLKCNHFFCNESSARLYLYLVQKRHMTEYVLREKVGTNVSFII